MKHLAAMTSFLKTLFKKKQTTTTKKHLFGSFQQPQVSVSAEAKKRKRVEMSQL